jgi:hypothetical protein
MRKVVMEHALGNRGYRLVIERGAGNEYGAARLERTRVSRKTGEVKTRVLNLGEIRNWSLGTLSTELAAVKDFV